MLMTWIQEHQAHTHRVRERERPIPTCTYTVVDKGEKTDTKKKTGSENEIKIQQIINE